MKPLITENFMLTSAAGEKLYHDYAAEMPIIDYHCHLPPQQIAEDARWENLAQIWLGGDHYKWRLMRADGIDEAFVTGSASDREKFQKFAEAMPHMLCSPMYHWSHLELARYFGIDDVLLSGETAEAVWARSKERMAQADFSARGLMQQSRVKVVCTTDDPTDSLKWHAQIAAESNFDIRVLPTWRPDKGFAIGKTAAWNAWMDALGVAADVAIRDLESFIFALQKRHNYFSSLGCRLSDYGLATIVAEPWTEQEIAVIFAKARSGKAVEPIEVAKFQSYLLVTCGQMDAESDWTWQLHYNVLRNNNTRLFQALGPDIGCDSIGDFASAEALGRLLDTLEQVDKLPRTIVYTLNPCDNEMITSMIGNFQKGPIPGKLQFGSGWWFNDQKDGMERQLETVSQMGLLSRFVGMLTDSRSFLSYTRHEYFRRILCNKLGLEMDAGRVPHDFDLVGGMVQDICYRNAERYFKF